MDSIKKESVTTQVHEIYIRAAPQLIWDALTTPEWATKYGYCARAEYELKPGGTYRSEATQQMRDMGLPEVIIDGEVIEAKPPHKLVQTFRFLFSEQNKAEGFPASRGRLRRPVPVFAGSRSHMSWKTRQSWRLPQRASSMNAAAAAGAGFSVTSNPCSKRVSPCQGEL